MVVILKQLHQTTKHVHDCHHDEHSFPMVGLMYVVLLDKWLIVQLGFFAQLDHLHSNVIHWLFPFVLHPCLVHS
jgi:hypothetical protein